MISKLNSFCWAFFKIKRETLFGVSSAEIQYEKYSSLISPTLIMFPFFGNRKQFMWFKQVIRRERVKIE